MSVSYLEATGIQKSMLVTPVLDRYGLQNGFGSFALLSLNRTIFPMFYYQ